MGMGSHVCGRGETDSNAEEEEGGKGGKGERGVGLVPASL